MLEYKFRGNYNISCNLIGDSHWLEMYFSAQKLCKFPQVIQKYTKFEKFAHDYIFRILQHFGTKRCTFTNFRMLFLGVVMDFILPF